jgi:hypothetical protein
MERFYQKLRSSFRIFREEWSGTILLSIIGNEVKKCWADSNCLMWVNGVSYQLSMSWCKVGWVDSCGRWSAGWIRRTQTCVREKGWKVKLMVLLDLYIHIFLGYANYIFSSLTGMFDRCVQFRPWLLHTQTNVFLDTQDCEEKKPHSNLLLQVIQNNNG